MSCTTETQVSWEIPDPLVKWSKDVSKGADQRELMLSYIIVGCQ